MYLRIWDCQYSIWNEIHGTQILDETEMPKKALRWAKKNFPRNRSGWEAMPEELTKNIEFEEAPPVQISQKWLNEVVDMAKKGNIVLTRVMGDDGYYTDKFQVALGNTGNVHTLSWDLDASRANHMRSIYGDPPHTENELEAMFKRTIIFRMNVGKYTLID